MAYCSKCGKEIDDNAVVCIHCGCETKKGAISGDVDRPATGSEILLAVLFPIVGAVLFYAYKSTKPTAAKKLNTVSMLAFLGWIVVGILWGILNIMAAA